MKQLQALDYLVVAIYFLSMAAIGLRMGRRQTSTLRYFLAGRSLPTWVVAFTLMGTIIGTGTIVGLPGTVFEKGMILLLGHLTLPVVLVLVALFVVPFYRNVVGMSAYEYIRKRFGRGSRVYSSAGFLADRIFDLGLTILTTAIAVYVMTGWPMNHVVLAVGIFTIFYTALGGMEAVAWTSAVQGLVMIAGALIVLASLLFAPEAGAPGAVVRAAWEGGRLSLGDFSFTGLFDAKDTSQWLFMLAYVVGWGRRYAADQHMVQRYLTARTDREASWSAMWGGLICVPMWLGFMFIGACLYGYYRLTGGSVPTVPDEIVPHYLVNVLPAGLVGLILSAVLAASMSSVSGDLNSVATVLTVDYFAVLAPGSSDRRRLWFGRFMVLVGGGLATFVAWTLLPREGAKPVMERAVTIAAIISAGSLGLFLLGFLTRRATRSGCYAGIAACLLFSAWGILTSGGDGRLVDMGFNFTLNPILIGVFSHVILFGVGYVASLVLPGAPPADVEALTIWRVLHRQAQSAPPAETGPSSREKVTVGQN